MRERKTGHASIQIKNAFANNLRIDTLEIDCNGIVAIDGPSGSGKSSLLFDVIHRESQFRTLRALQSGVKPLEGLPEPADAEVGILPTISALRQDDGVLWPGRIKLGEITHLLPLLRSAFIKLGNLYDPGQTNPMLFYKPAELSKFLISHYNGKRIHCLAPMRVEQDYAKLISELIKQGYARMAVGQKVLLLNEAPVKEPKSWSLVIDRLKISGENIDRLELALQNAFSAGNHQLFALVEDEIHTFHEHPYSNKNERFLPLPNEKLLRDNHPEGWCEACKGFGHDEHGVCSICSGTGLSGYQDLLKIGGLSYREALTLPITGLLEKLPPGNGHQTLKLIHDYLQPLISLGLGELSLKHPARWLSSGERSRVRLCGLINTAMPGSLLLIDEPSLGLSTNDCTLLVDYLLKLKESHSMIVIDHHNEILRIANRTISMGPGSGPSGGKVTENMVVQIDAVQFPEGRGSFRVKMKDNRKYIGYESQLNVIVGDSGTGKTRLLRQLSNLKGTRDKFVFVHSLNHINKVNHTRSCVATLADIWTPIRELLALTTTAKIHGFEPSRFSFNTTIGRCETCKGLGTVNERFIGLPTFESTCPNCGGMRFDALTRKVRFRNLNITDILSLSISQSLEIFSAIPSLFPVLSALNEIGLGHLNLGQPSHTLSGGENRRLHIGRTLGKAHRRGEDLKGHLFLLDEPTAALHPSDSTTLLRSIATLCDRGATFVCATHEPSLIQHAKAILNLNSSVQP